MLVLALFLMACAEACAEVCTRKPPFNVTYLSIPQIVPMGQHEVIFECRYSGNFTILSWFKGNREFFRYRPGAAPSIRSFPVGGVGSIEMLNCGPNVCQLKLGELTEEATGLYKCDLERDVPPYKFANLVAHMEVHGEERRKPFLDGLAKEYTEGDTIRAYCRGAKDSVLRWYVNGIEDQDMKMSTTFMRHSTRLFFKGQPPTITVQCAEFRNGKLYGSKEMKARWNEVGHIRENYTHLKNESSSMLGRLNYIGWILCLLNFKFD